MRLASHKKARFGREASQDDPNKSGIPNLIIFLSAGQSETRSGRGAEEVVNQDKVGKNSLDCRYEDELREQMESKRRLDEEQKRKEREEEERLDRRTKEQQERLKREFDEETNKQRAKQEAVR